MVRTRINLLVADGDGTAMSMLGNIVRELTKTVSNVGEALVNGAADVTEVVTGKNQVTTTVRNTGVGVFLGAKALSDAVVGFGEELLGVREDPSRGASTTEQGAPTEAEQSNAPQD